MFRLRNLCLGWVSLRFELGAVVCIRLFWPFRAFSLDVFGLLRPIGWIVGLGQGYCARRSMFHLFCWDLLVDPLCYIQTMHFQTLWPFKVLCLDLDRLFGLSLVHGSSHEKKHSKLAWAGFWRRQDASWYGQDASQHGQDASRHGQDASLCRQDTSHHMQGLNWCGQVHKSSSPVSRSLCQTTIGSAM